MTVYVYKLEHQGGFLFGRTAAPDPWFALTADSDDELHAFAESLGLTRIMFRPETPGGRKKAPVAGHYDVTIGERDRAVAQGAKLITASEAERIVRQRAPWL
ncbi:MAG TPA: DUF4031 domain-containing protein [Streptosporangiaceae bacterium]|nr:DUF4031 domain-containing protein [Streptosporangiaceae bacterium]